MAKYTPWLISANGKIYDHASSFAHFGSIDWRQGGTLYQIGDVVYIYCTSPIQRVRYKCRVTEINKTKETIRNDEQYWNNIDEYKKSLDGKFVNLQLIEEADSPKLSLEALIENGLKAAPQGPIKLNEGLVTYISSIFNTANDEAFPDTLAESEAIYEGLKTQTVVNKYERSSIARAKCVESNGYTCKVCDFDFEKTYGPIGNKFIHVHHIIPLYQINSAYKIDYKKDLIPVCPNCHAMLHRSINGNNYTIDQLRELVNQRKQSTQCTQ